MRTGNVKLHPESLKGFTLIELLTVIAVIGILVALIIPTVSGARDSANRARTKAQFSQWAAAMELYRQEYGFYPNIAVSGKLDGERFAAELTGRTLTGQSVGGGSFGNVKGLTFYDLSPDDLADNGIDLIDGFGNTDLAVRIDSNRDGRINGSDSGTWIAVKGATSNAFSPADDDSAVPVDGVRAKVVFYSAGRGRDVSDLILSWR